MVEIEVDRSFRAAVPAALKAGQSLVWDGSGPMIVYDDKGRKVTEAAIGQALPPLGKGQHSIAIDARFAGAGEVIKRPFGSRDGSNSQVTRHGNGYSGG